MTPPKFCLPHFISRIKFYVGEILIVMSMNIEFGLGLSYELSHLCDKSEAVHSAAHGRIIMNRTGTFLPVCD